MGEEPETVWTRLLASRCSPADKPAIAKPGVYALFLNAPNTLAGLAVGSDGLLYVGTSSNLKGRNHFSYASSGSSSPRRSLGAVLKQKLALSVIPGGASASQKDITHFRFTPLGERELSTWMLDHLDYAFAIVEQDAPKIEGHLIAQKRPPLNLKKWRNPQRHFIEACRQVCQCEASQARLTTLKLSNE